MSTPKTPTWLPNWRDPSAYPNPKDNISAAQWAWEFIRRNPEYQRLYRIGKRHQKRWLENNKANKNFSRYYQCSPLADKNESYDEYIFRCHAEGVIPEVKPKIEQILKKFPVAKFSKDLDPKNKIPPEFTDNYDYPYIYDSVDYEKRFSYRINGRDEVMIVFSLALPLNNQIDVARDYLIDSQYVYKEEGNKVRHKWRVDLSVLGNYLRYLDADTNGITQAEMAKVIYPNQNELSTRQRVNKGLGKALEYRNEGFYKILKTELL